MLDTLMDEQKKSQKKVHKLYVMIINNYHLSFEDDFYYQKIYGEDKNSKSAFAHLKAKLRGKIFKIINLRIGSFGNVSNNYGYVKTQGFAQFHSSYELNYRKENNIGIKYLIKHFDKLNQSSLFLSDKLYTIEILLRLSSNGSHAYIVKNEILTKYSMLNDLNYAYGKYYNLFCEILMYINQKDSTQSERNKDIFKCMLKMYSIDEVWLECKTVSTSKERLEIMYIRLRIIYIASLFLQDYPTALLCLTTMRKMLATEPYHSNDRDGGILLAIGHVELAQLQFKRAERSYMESMRILKFNGAEGNYYKAYLKLLRTFILLSDHVSYNKYRNEIIYLKLDKYQDLKSEHLYYDIVHKFIVYKYDDCLNLINGDRNVHQYFASLRVGLKMYEILCLVELNLLDLIPLRIDSFRKHMYKNSDEECFRVTIFLKIMNIMEKYGFQKAKPELFVKIKNIYNLNRIKLSSTWNPLNYELYKYDDWLFKRWFVNNSKEHLQLNKAGDGSEGSADQNEL